MWMTFGQVGLRMFYDLTRGRLVIPLDVITSQEGRVRTTGLAEERAWGRHEG